jgi:phage terminase large subunit-like protein
MQLRNAIAKAGRAALTGQPIAIGNGVGNSETKSKSAKEEKENGKSYPDFLHNPQLPLGTANPGNPLDIGGYQDYPPVIQRLPDIEPILEPITPDNNSDIWDMAPWLSPLRVIPDNAAWPRLMSPPNPLAVGSYGPDAEFWAQATWQVHLRWWQRLALYRLLEYDADGQLVWPDALVSTARQVGKSILLRVLAGWRMHDRRLGDSPLVLHTGKDLPVCREVQQPARVWARQMGGYRVREANGETEISAPTGGRWLVRARQSVYGYSADVALVDEAWRVTPEIVEDALEPTLTEKPNGQLVLFSTAHRQATPLVLLRRAAMLAAWGEDTGSLLLEWSAPAATDDLGDQLAWRQASPHWSKSRERLLTQKLARVRKGVSADPDEDDPVESFRAQFLNVWPARELVTTHRDEPLVDPEAWQRLGDLSAAPAAGAPLVVAVEDYYGLGAAAAAASVLPDGRVLVWGSLHATRPEAYAWAAWVVGERDTGTVLVGATLDAATVRDWLPGLTVLPQTTVDTRTALPLLRSLVTTGRLAHADEPALTGQMCAVRVVPSGAGGLQVPHRGMRSDLVRAAGWAVQAVTRPEAGWQPFYAY